MSYHPIVSEAPMVIEAPATADVGIICGGCLATLTPAGACINVGACEDADRIATRYARRSTLKAPMAVTRSGNVD